MRIGKIVPVTEAEGPGRRTAIWFQGCSLHCEGCCNPEFLDSGGGLEMSVDHIFDFIPIREVEGVTLLGGEPLEQYADLRTLICRIREAGLTNMLFSGRTWAALNADPKTKEIITMCDLIVAGPFQKGSAPDPRRWIGSTNQTIHFQTQQYQELAKNWELNLYDVEVHISNGELQFHGAPELIELLMEPRSAIKKGDA